MLTVAQHAEITGANIIVLDAGNPLIKLYLAHKPHGSLHLCLGQSVNALIFAALVGFL